MKRETIHVVDDELKSDVRFLKSLTDAQQSHIQALDERCDSFDTWIGKLYGRIITISDQQIKILAQQNELYKQMNLILAGGLKDED